MNPYPLVGLNHFTVPVAMRPLLALFTQVNCSCIECAMQQIRVLADDLRATQRELGKADQKLGGRSSTIDKGNGSMTPIRNAVNHLKVVESKATGEPQHS